MPASLSTILAQIGSYWWAIFVYAGLLLALVDLLRLILRKTKLLAAWKLRSQATLRMTGTVIFTIILTAIIYGTWRARTPVVTEYTLNIAKPAGSYRELSVVLVSDNHLGLINGNGRIQELVTMVNQLQPDLILIAGDLIDDDFKPFLDQAMASELSKLQARLGIYAIMGNHDVRDPELPSFRAELEQAGIQLLIDEWVVVDNSLVLAGRDDPSPPRAAGEGMALADIIANTDRSLPLLVMDHNPNRLNDTIAVEADLQVSGHTHAGQIFPFNLVTNMMYEEDWGALQRGSTHVVVSSGFGTWGPPMRIGTYPEVVHIQLTFGQ
ncbi:MAG TPA: metallophosphoesterase [Herpetosiphon sp.]|nr:metallophosphoesterase [Herpetosiphon sp.]